MERPKMVGMARLLRPQRVSLLPMLFIYLALTAVSVGAYLGGTADGRVAYRWGALTHVATASPQQAPERP